MYQTFKKIGIVVSALLSLYGTVRLGQDIGDKIHQLRSTPESYILSIYYRIEQESCGYSRTTLPDGLRIFRRSDNHVLLDSYFCDAGAGRPAPEFTWQCQELTDILRGELKVRFVGAPARIEERTQYTK